MRFSSMAKRPTGRRPAASKRIDEAFAVLASLNVPREQQNELKALFGSARSGLVFVTAFLTRRTMTRYLSEIAWETEVWIGEAPSHIIHFNGERFLGPYE
jgi:adenine-specific DNA-methyltransferase